MAEQVDDCIKFNNKKVIKMTGSFHNHRIYWDHIVLTFVDIESRNMDSPKVTQVKSGKSPEPNHPNFRFQP